MLSSFFLKNKLLAVILREERKRRRRGGRKLGSLDTKDTDIPPSRRKRRPFSLSLSGFPRNRVCALGLECFVMTRWSRICLGERHHLPLRLCAHVSRQLTVETKTRTFETFSLLNREFIHVKMVTVGLIQSEVQRRDKCWPSLYLLQGVVEGLLLDSSVRRKMLLQ